MRSGRFLVLCVCILLCGCTRSQVNEVALVKYDYSDNAGEIALKTTANIIAGAVAVPLAAACFAIMAVGSNGGRLSGGASSKGVSLGR